LTTIIVSINGAPKVSEELFFTFNKCAWLDFSSLEMIDEKTYEVIAWIPLPEPYDDTIKD